MGADIALFKHLPLLILKRQRIIQLLDDVASNESPTASATATATASSRTVTLNNKKNDKSNSSKSEQHLTLLSTQYNEEHVSIIEEISNTFTALEMVLRCSAESISTCHARIGVELFTFLIDIIQDFCNTLTIVVMDSTKNGSSGKKPTSSSSLISEGKEVTNDSSQDNNDNNTNDNHEDKDGDDEKKNSTIEQENSSSSASLQKSTTKTSAINPQPLSNVLVASKVILRTATKIIAHFGRVGSLTEALAYTPKLLDTLCNVISMPRGNGYNDEYNIPIEARLNCLWIIANLACSADNMVFMARHERITENLFETISHPSCNEESTCKDIEQFICLLRMRSVAIRALLNLSWAQQNKIPFSENVGLVESILRIASHRKSPWCGSGRGVSAILLQSRRHACGTLRNLAAAPRKYKRRLCRLQSGKFLDLLADIARNDHDFEIKEKIFATLFNLVSADTAKMFTEKKDVLDVIISTATAPEEKNERDGSSTGAVINRNNLGGCRKMAENILQSLEKALPEDDEGYDALRPALSRFDSQIAMNRSSSNLGSVTRTMSNLGSETLSVSNFGNLNLPSMSTFSLSDMNPSLSHSTLNPETV